jgi:hypothetical protein
VTPAEEVALIIGGDLTYGSWADDPAAVIAAVVGRAADARMGGRVKDTWSREAVFRLRSNAEFHTHLACALVVAADNPSIERGAVLDALVDRFGDGLP